MYAAHKIDSSHQRLFPAIGECAFRQISRRRNTIRTPARHAMTAIRTPRRAGGPVVPCVNVNHRRKGTANTPAALKSIRAVRPDGAPIYVILKNLSAHTGVGIRRWAKKEQGQAVLHLDLRLLGPPDRGLLRQFTLANADHRSHPAQTRALHRYPCWRNIGARPTPTRPCSPAQ
ncbi:hypothetical protein ACWEWL_29430 [Streptomyces rochei]|uniref:hypothetical protein n=1 Tax=Streptomyces rochei group TaxID=2867164 RepID=UPI003D08CCAA